MVLRRVMDLMILCQAAHIVNVGPVRSPLPTADSTKGTGVDSRLKLAHSPHVLEFFQATPIS